MGEFGDRLRQEREKRGITLNEISESTKISRRRLEALENEEFDLLPGGVFNRGFVRSYARHIGIDPEQAVAEYLAASHEQSAPEDQFPLDVQEDRSRNGTPVLNPRRSWKPVVFAVLVLVAVVAGWTMWTHRNPVRQAVSKATVTPVEAATAPGPRSSSVPEVKSPQTGTANATPAGPKASSSGAAPGPQQAAVNKQAPPRLRSNTLAIVARADSWVSIIADGKTVMEGVLDANQERSVKFENNLVLRTGNAGGLEVSYNGKPLGPLGAENQVRTLQFLPKARVQ
jgi:cytoskeleton protein RodZ